MTELEARIASLSPEKRRLLERRLARAGLDRRSRERGGRTIPRRAEGPGPWPLSYGQRRLWFIDRLNPGTPAYNIPFAGRLAGPLHAHLLAQALAEVVRRHEVLRSRFVEEDGRPVQVVDPTDPMGRPVRLPVVDLSRLDDGRRDAEARRLTDADPQLPFDLARGPVVRMTLLRLAAGLHDLLVTMPHIVTDAWSMAVLFRELPALYDAFRAGRPSPLPEPPVQVADYALWERERLDGSPGGGGGEAGGRLAEELDFWRRHLAGAPTVLELPTDRPRPPVQTMRGIRRAVSVPAATARRLEALADREGATPFMALLASFAAVLGRWSGQDDLLLASPLATRGEPEVQGLIGFFIDNAVLRVDLSGGPGFRRLLGRVRESALATFAHQGAPFEKVAEAVGAGGDLSRPPLAQVNFVLQNVHIPAPEFEELSLVRAQQTDTRSSRFDLSLGLFETDGGLDGWLEYSTDLFDATTVARLERDWLHLLEGALERPDAPLSELPRSGPAARHQLLVEWNDTARAWPEAGVHDLVARWAETTPDAVAVTWDGEGGSVSLTYAGLHARAIRLAGRLQVAGAGPGRPVAVALPRSPEQVVALLATLRAGACYVPLEPGMPAPRLAAMAEVAGPAVVVAPPGLALPVPGAAVLELPGPPAGEGGAGEADGQSWGEALAYVLFTSGSTGEPRGVAVPHRAVVRLVEGLDAYAPSGPGDTFLALAPLAFDASTFEIWGALGRGARLALFPDAPLSLEALGSALARQRVTTLWLTAGLFHLVADREPRILAGLRRLLAGGDVLSPGAVGRVLRELPHLELVNGYGPTEATTFTCCHRVREEPAAGRSVPLGRPIPGTRVHVAGRDLRPASLGVPGELLAAGPGLARGYRGRRAATAAAFVPDPFAGEPGSRLYRTGDLARHRPDGTVEFLGRIDRQVKVRGFRVEPREVEAALEEHPAVAEAVVDLRGGRLAAWVVPAGAAAEDDLRPASLRGFLDGRLPEFAVPSAFVAVPELPLTANGKVDRERLPDPGEALAAAAGDGGPATAAEETLAGVWREVLGLDRVGVHDRFFDLGGDSILAIRVISRAAEEGLRLEARHLFEHPTVAGLAAVAEAVAPAAPSEEGGGTGPVPLGPAQRWLLEGLAPPVPNHWNLALLLEPAERLGLDGLAARVRGLLARHDLLRARFRREAGRWHQEVAPPGGPAPVAAVDLSALPGKAGPAALDRALADGQASLDLAHGPLVRLVRLDLPAPAGGGRGSTRLLLVVHHLVADAVSLRILLEDLGRPEGSPTLPRTASYRAWVEALETWAASPDAEEELAAWRAMGRAGGREEERQAAGAPRERDAGTVEATLPPEPTAALLERSADTLRARPDEVLLAGLAAALHRTGGESPDEAGAAPRQGVVRVEVEGHGRRLPGSGAALDLSRTVGWFTALYPVRIDLGDQQDGTGGAVEPARVLRAVKQALRSVPAGGVGYAALLWGDQASGGGTRSSLRAAPEPEVSFNYLGRLDEALGPGGPFRLAPEPPGLLRHRDAPRGRPLEVTAWVLDGALRTVWTFDRRRYRTEEVADLAERALAVTRRLAEAGAEAAVHPTDFPDADLDAGSLARLVGRLEGG